jgi:hypothetical protein
MGKELVKMQPALQNNPGNKLFLFPILKTIVAGMDKQPL